MDKNKTPMIDKVTNFTQACEEVTEELTSSAGMIVTKTTPLLAPVASGLCTLFAFYDGGGRMLTGKVNNPYGWSLAAGLVLFAVVEGINFAVQFTRDRGEQLKAQHPEQLAFLKLDRMVVWCFLLTLSTIAMLETIPGAVAWYYGEIAGADFGFRVGLLILPFFSKMGASIFSVSMLLDALEGTAEARRQRRRQEKLEAAKLEVEIENMRQQTAWELEQRKAEATQRLELERLKVEAKLNGNRSESVRKSVRNDDPYSVEQEPNTEPNTKPNSALDKVNASRKHQREIGKARMLEIYSARPDASLRDIGEELGKSASTISEWLKELESDRMVTVNGAVHVRGEDN